MSLVLANGQVVTQEFILGEHGSLYIQDAPKVYPTTSDLIIHDLNLDLKPDEIVQLGPVIRHSAHVIIRMVDGYDYSILVRDPNVLVYHFIYKDTIYIYKRNVPFVYVRSDTLGIPILPWPMNRVRFHLMRTILTEPMENVDAFVEHMTRYVSYTFQFNSPMFEKLVWEFGRFNLYFNAITQHDFGEISTYFREISDYIHDHRDVVRSPDHYIRRRFRFDPLKPDGRWVLGEPDVIHIPGMRFPRRGLTVEEVRKTQELLLVLASVRAIPRLSTLSKFQVIPSELIRRMSNLFA